MVGRGVKSAPFAPFSKSGKTLLRRGILHGPIRNVGPEPLTIYAIGTAFQPRAAPAPSRANPTVDPLKNTTRYCKYSNTASDRHGRSLEEGPGGLGCTYSGPHTADRVSWGAGGYAPCASMPGHPEGSCLQAHYHPKGALYIGLSGRTFCKCSRPPLPLLPKPEQRRVCTDAQDYDGFDAWIDGGDVRWVRPGRWYGPEYTNNGCTILAMHPSFGGSGDCKADAAHGGDCVSSDGFEGSWVSWTKPPPGPYSVQYTLTLTRTLGGD